MDVRWDELVFCVVVGHELFQFSWRLVDEDLYIGFESFGGEGQVNFHVGFEKFQFAV
jgi:hypothetical protein